MMSLEEKVMNLLMCGIVDGGVGGADLKDYFEYICGLLWTVGSVDVVDNLAVPESIALTRMACTIIAS